jgi:nitrogen fixation protein FixH
LQCYIGLFTHTIIEDIMAKKTAKKKTPAKKATATKAKKKAPAKKAEHVEIELAPVETKAFELAHSSAKVQKELEEAATLAMSQAVRKVFKQHGISLTPPQAQIVAAVLFGD